MKILALDLATVTGWAFFDGERTESGVQDFSKRRGESNGMLFLKFNRWIRQEVPIPDLIVYEQPAIFRSGAANEIAVGLSTRIEEFCAENGIDHAAVPVPTLKKWATGHGNAKKPEMIARAQEIKGSAVADDNEADAVLLLAYTRKEIV